MHLKFSAPACLYNERNSLNLTLIVIALYFCTRRFAAEYTGVRAVLRLTAERTAGKGSVSKFSKARVGVRYQTGGRGETSLSFRKGQVAWAGTC